MAEATNPFEGYAYSLGARCGAEFIGTGFAIWIGESTVANLLLQKTKGNGMGFLALAVGFGFPFGMIGFMFGHISSVLNPAICMAQWVLGLMTFKEFALLSLSEIAGAIWGAIMVYLTYLPHFHVVPEVPRGLILGDGSDRDRKLAVQGTLRPTSLRTPSLLIPGPTALLESAGRGYGAQQMNVASYEDTQVEFDARHGGLGGALSDIRQRLENTVQRQREHAEAIEEAVTRGASREDMAKVLAGLRDDLNKHEEDTRTQLDRLNARDTAPKQTASSDEGIPVERAGTVETDTASLSGPPGGGRSKSLKRISHWVVGKDVPKNHAEGPSDDTASIEDDKSLSGSRRPNTIDLEAEKDLARYRAQLRLDADIKLSIFATRPAIYHPLHNFFVEIIMTVGLIFCLLLISFRAITLYQPSRAVYQTQINGWIGIIIAVFILGFGGVTGLCVNPARDFGPRVAHFFLPIPGKGSSEFFSYGWIPFFAPFAGGAIAGGFVKAYLKMNHSFVADIMPV